MKNTINFLQIFLLICGVFGVDADEVKTVMEGESVTLNTDLTETLGFNQILWRFEDKGPVIAQIVGIDISYPDLTEIFGGRLQIDHQTGSLTIKNMRIKHSGLYKLKISQNTGSTSMTFRVTVYESPAVIDAYKAEMKTVSGTEGNPVTLQTDVTEPHGDELIVWRFGDEGKLIAKHDIEAKSSPLYDTDERFKDRLKLDEKTGSLTITNTKHITDSGLYTVKISSSKQTLYKKFNVIISAPGLSSGDVVGIVVGVLLAVAAVAAVINMRSRRPEREKKIDSIDPDTVNREEGESAVLPSDHDIMEGDQMLWTRVSVKESAIASVSENDKKTYWYDPRYRGRLQLDPHTGSLIIRNLRKTDAGVYVLEIKSRGGTSYRKYKVILSGEVKTVSVKEGDDAILKFSKDSGNSINWEFGNNYFIASLIENDNESDSDGRFRHRLQLDKQTGSLTIKNIRPEHTGLYTALSKPGNNFTKFSVVCDDFTETSENESEITGFLGRIQRFCGLARIEGVFGDEKDEMKTLSVMEGVDLKLHTETEIQPDDEIILRFETSLSKNRPYVTIARFSKPDDEFKSEERRFKDRLQWNLTGPLTITITDFINTDCGDYYVQITNKKKKSFKSFTFIVVPSDAVTVAVTEGESINLVSPITNLQENDQVLWTFRRHDMIIADTNTSRCVKRFKDRVDLNKTTGSLTIRESTIEDEGEYNLRIISGNRVIHQRFKVIVFDIAVISEPVMEGEYINLVSPITDLQKEDQVLWTFGRHGMIIADTNTTRCDERFKDRVNLDKKSGSLTIIKSRTADDGKYNLHIITGNRVRNQRFNVTVLENMYTPYNPRDHPEAEDVPLPRPPLNQPESEYENDAPIIQKQTDSSGNRENDVTVVMPLLDEENEQEGTSSL